ncbi:Protein red1 like protein [Verticillium longisporum]|uniref:Protein red1 like protein n=1 Tax=Verticillium longisporum TaxID=100787 RepID=A0A8I2ZUY4_VERLO|nr:Protein red1 like protein [Verticillium longisporum]
MTYNSYYGGVPYQGQSSYAPSLYPAQPTYSQPASGQPPPNGNAFPSFNMASAQASYEQNRSVIPGLAFGASTSDVPAAWQQTHQPTHAQPSHEPNLVPASQYYQPHGGRSNGASNKRSEQPGNGLKRQHASDRAEEGELSEGEYDDLAQSGKQVWPDAAAGPGDAPTTGRDSYSPYLSPHEIQPALKPVMSQAVVRTKEQSSHPIASQVAAAPPAAPSADVLLQAKTKARSAILGLWSLDVRYDDFVSEGIDKDLVRVLFNDLGLDPVPGSHPVKDGGLGSHIPGLSSSNQNKGTRPVMPQNNVPHIAQPSASASSSAKEPVVAATGKAEERKDRIARLLAAKQALSGTTTAAVSTGTVGAENSNEKQLKLQQKMVALQKSREARAQKAASRKGSEAAQPAPPTTTNGLPSIPPPSLSVTSTPTHPLPAKVDIPVPDSARSVIPGLFMPSTSQHAQSPSNQRKRPVASDFDDYAQANIHTHPPGPLRKSKLVIDVSEGSDDDVEMEIGSGDESNTNVQSSDHPFRRTTSFRDVPPLSEPAGQRQFSDTGPARVATPPGHLAVMDKQIEAMKRKIALAEARKKLKSALSGSNGQAALPKSGGPTPETAADSDTATPSLRRVQSLDPSLSVGSNTNRSSPVAPETGSIKLPKNRDIAGSGSDRLQRVRVLSQSLPGMQSRLQAKKSKLRLLQSQMARLEKEIEQEDAEKRSAEDELDGLQELVASGEDEPPYSPNGARRTTAQESIVDDAETALPLTSTIADKGADKEDTDGGVELPSLVRDDDAGKTAEPVTPSALESFTGGQTDPAIAAQHTPTLEMAAEAPKRSSPDTGVSSGASPVPVSGDSHASNVADHSGESEDTVAVIDDDDVLPLTDPGIGSQSPTGDVYAQPVQISVGIDESHPDEGLNNNAREVQPRPAHQDGRSSSENGFTPYESPFQLFRNYRYHPDFQKMVAGGLRSLTYSNKIDPNIPVCPDQLDGRTCPKGSECEYQHFESMKLPDDQILLQLGGTNVDGPMRVQYNNGLRELLQDMRQRNIKDFPSIAQGIVDYHNRFTGDPSRILTLGDVLI